MPLSVLCTIAKGMTRDKQERTEKEVVVAYLEVRRLREVNEVDHKNVCQDTLCFLKIRSWYLS
jgi:hypothetical protein